MKPSLLDRFLGPWHVYRTYQALRQAGHWHMGTFEGIIFTNYLRKVRDEEYVNGVLAEVLIIAEAEGLNFQTDTDDE